MRRTLTIALLFSLAGAAFGAREISVRTLLPELTDLRSLAKKPSPPFKEAQASSYDRASVGPDKPNWFANGDAGQFIRVEDRDGHREYVMLDARGPGAIVRFWSANPSGVVRFYFDGATAPNWECKLDDLLGGKIQPLTDPFGYVASSGWNLFFPIPYAKSLKVTVDEGGRGIYYQIGYRTYAAGTTVRTFSQDDLDGVKALMAGIANELLTPRIQWVGDLAKGSAKRGFVVAPGATKTVISTKAAKTGSCVFLLSAKVLNATAEDRTGPEKWSDPKAIQNMLRNVLLEVDFDGERCVEAPLGDFFGTAPGINAFKTLPMEVGKDGWMTCRFRMPFRKDAKFRLVNVGSVVARVALEAQVEAAKFDKDTYHFHAQWTAERSRTRPFKDMHWLDVKGEGAWVGVVAHVANPVPDWWGEGDEKVYVDGEPFPSTFGTGTEDYFGYAWCNPTPFVRPFHAQPRADGPGNFGHTNLMRWQVFDRIPYTRSLKFDMELWHWADTTLNYARTAYWYARPGGTAPLKIDRSLLVPPYLVPGNKVAGALEGETLTYRATGGEVQVQDGIWPASGGKHLWWHHVPDGSKLDVDLPVASAGEYEVIVHFITAGDYGRHAVRLLGGSDDARSTAVDLYSTGIESKSVSLGTYRLAQGKVVLEFTSNGRNPAASPGNMLGLDYVLLKKR